MDKVLIWYDRYNECDRTMTSRRDYLDTCPDDVRQAFVDCAWDTFEECERVLDGPLPRQVLCPRTLHMSDEYKHNMHVLRVMQEMIFVIDVPRHDEILRGLNRLDELMYDIRGSYAKYTDDVLLVDHDEDEESFVEDDPDFHSRRDVDPDEWNAAYRAEYRRLWDTTHPNRYFPKIVKRWRIARNQDRDGAAQARADFYERFPENPR